MARPRSPTPGRSSITRTETASLIKTHAILIRRMRLTETSLIVSWCSEDHGLIKTVAKGALRPKSPLAGRLDLFLSADLAYTESRRSDLHTLREAEIANPRLGLRTSWPRVAAASYFVHLIEQVAERATPIPDLFDLLTRALDYLESHEPDQRAVLHYERQLARALGLQSTHGGTAIEAIRHHFHFSATPRDALLRAIQKSGFGATSDPDAGS